jgi:hypothetical protein
MKRIQTTLEKIARLYDLVEEMREIIRSLHEVEVEVKISSLYSGSDPLAEKAAIMVVLRPGCDVVPR